MPHQQLLWASDFPHTDSTWPRSQQLLAEHTAHLAEQQRQDIMRENAAKLFHLPAGNESWRMKWGSGLEDDALEPSIERAPAFLPTWAPVDAYANRDLLRPVPSWTGGGALCRAGAVGAQDVTTSWRGIFHRSVRPLLCSQSHSRIASRVLWRVFRGAYRDEHDIFQAAQALPWPTWFPVRRTIKVKVSAQQCPYPAWILSPSGSKTRICDCFRAPPVFVPTWPRADLNYPR